MLCLYRSAIGAAVLVDDLVAVLLRIQLAQNPFSSIDAKPRALNMFAIDGIRAFAVFAFPPHPVVCSVICDVQHLIEMRVSLDFPRSRILVTKTFVLSQPSANGSL